MFYLLADASWALSYITDIDSEKIQTVIDHGCVPYLVDFLQLQEAAIVIPALRTVGNIVTGTDAQV